MKRITKIILSLVLVFTMLVLPVCGGVASYNADETTQGNITAANYYDYTFSPYRDIIVWASDDSTATLLSITGQPAGTFAWFYNFVLEYDEAKGAWVVTKADMTMTDSANQSESETLGKGKMVVMFHDLVTKEQQASYDFFINNVEVGKEFYLTVDPSAVFEVYDLVDGVALSTVKVDVAPPAADTETGSEATSEKDDDASNKGEADNQISPLVIVTVVVVLVAAVGGFVIVKKRKAE